MADVRGGARDTCPPGGVNSTKVWLWMGVIAKTIDVTPVGIEPRPHIVSYSQSNTLLLSRVFHKLYENANTTVWLWIGVIKLNKLLRTQ